jgi:UTP:GlnB (protein PII) uridylyltransferase
LRDASPLWLMSEPPAILAGDLALCHPRLKRREVRAVARPIEGSDAVRLTVVAHDRPGLLADSAAVLASHGMSVAEASAGTWAGLALHAFTLQPDRPADDEAWASLGRDLERMGHAPLTAKLVFLPVGRTSVEIDGPSIGRALVRITAHDQIGLLWAICRWFADHGISIESVHAATDSGIASDTFIVNGDCDGDELAAHLSSLPDRNPVGPRNNRWLVSHG